MKIGDRVEIHKAGSYSPFFADITSKTSVLNEDLFSGLPLSKDERLVSAVNNNLKSFFRIRR